MNIGKCTELIRGVVEPLLEKIDEKLEIVASKNDIVGFKDDVIDMIRKIENNFYKELSVRDDKIRDKRM